MPTESGSCDVATASLTTLYTVGNGSGLTSDEKLFNCAGMFIQPAKQTTAAPATIRANVFRAFISFLLSGFVLDRIYRIYKIKTSFHFP